MKVSPKYHIQSLPPEEVITPQGNSSSLGLKSIWNYRELIYILTWRDIKVRYKETLLGVIWVLFQPIVMTLVFSVFFGKLAKIPSGNLPYPIFVYIGLVVWTFFANAVSNSSNSLITNESIIKKVYFPRIIAPISAVLTSSFDFFITLILGVIIIFYFQLLPNPLIVVLLPIVFITLLFLILGLGLTLSSLKVRYRDIRYVFPFFLQLGIFVTPVIYSFEIIYDYRRWLLAVNPLSGIIETLRTLISGSDSVNWELLVASIVISLIIFFLGIYYFRRTEIEFADII